MVRGTVTGLAILFGLLLLSPIAEACTCPGYRAVPVWPVPDATDVALDVTLIVAVSDAAAGVDYRLTDESGTDVPLTAMRTLEADDGCDLADHVFLRPAADLSQGRRYTVTPSFPFIEAGQVIVTSSAFTTGSSRRGLPASPSVELSLFGDEIGGARWLQVFAVATGGEPVFLRAIGARATVVQALGALAPATPAGIPLGNVACAGLELVDAAGMTFRNASLCEPSKCRVSTVYADTTCGGNPGGDSWERWQEIPDGCQPSPGLPGARTTSMGSGCVVAGEGEGEGGGGWLACAIITALFLSRRRRAGGRAQGCRAPGG